MTKINSIGIFSISAAALLMSQVATVSCTSRPSKSGKEDTEAVASNGQYTGKIGVNLFVESSGSMFPYDSKKGEGDFKSAITQLINEIPSSKVRDEQLYMVNDAVYPYEKTYTEFLRSKDIYSDSRNLGDINYTDFTAIFDTIFNHTGRGELSILVSDLIYSTKDMEDTNRQKILNETRGMTAKVFKDQGSSKKKDVLVVKMNGDYQGKYFAYNSPRKGVEYSGQRPYYFMMVADSDVMKTVFENKAFSNFSDFSKLPGYENFYCFADNSSEPYWSFMLSGSDKKGDYSNDGGKGYVHNIKDVKPGRNGELQLVLAVDLSSYITTDEYKLNPSNYEIESQGDLKVEKIEEIDRSTLTQVQKKYAGDATHFIVISSGDKIRYGNVTLKFINRLPGWISSTGSEDDTDINAPDFISTTFGFKYLMEGIRDAYYGAGNTPDFFSIDFKMTR